LGQPAVSVGGGWGSACALLADGNVQCWGEFISSNQAQQ
jgi:hypothetical protein